jgi:3-phenylpropionate/trans-cinnamate dioxygenase ferredoxin component
MPNWITIAEESELHEGEKKALEVNQQSLLLLKSQGTYYAIQNVCPHECLPLTEGTLEDHTLTCPFHGASFCIKTGAVKTPPAFSDLETYPVRVQDKQVQVQI